MVFLRERCSEDGHDRVADELHDGAAVAKDGVVHGGPVLVELARQLRRIGLLGDAGVAADVGHEHRHDHALGLADLATVGAQLLRQPAGEQARERLARLLPVDDRLVEHAEPTQRALGAGGHALGQLEEHGFDLGVDGLGGAAGRLQWP